MLLTFNAGGGDNDYLFLNKRVVKMKKVHAKKLGISVLLLLSVLVTGCGGGSGGTTSYKNSNINGFKDINENQYNRAANAKPQQGSVIQSNVNNTPGLGVDTTKTTLDFKQVAGGHQDVTVDSSNSIFNYLGVSSIGSGSATTTANVYEKSLADGDFFVIGGVADYGTDANDYLSFGLWAYLPDNTNSTPEIGFYTDGGDPFTKANIAGLTGTANYEMEDGALGLYNEGANVYVALGDVSLTADFDTDTISGNIDGIRLGNGFQQVPAVDGLNIALQKADIDATQEGGFWTGDTLTTNTQNTEQYEGKWGGQFYGNGADADDHPAFVSGTFGGAAIPSSGAIGSFVGAFIAEKQ